MREVMSFVLRPGSFLFIFNMNNNPHTIKTRSRATIDAIFTGNLENIESKEYN